MKQTTKTLILALLIVGLLAGAYGAYKKLSKQYGPAAQSLPEAAQAERPVAPDFTVLDADGESVNLSDYKGKPVVVNFWASWCVFCTMEMPAFQAAYDSYGEDVQFMMVNLTDGERETEALAKGYVSENEFTFPIYLDTEFSAANAYGVRSIPATVFVDKDGNIYGSVAGSLSESALNEYVNGLLKE